MIPSYAVITICRNAADTIGRAVQSVLDQYPPPTRYIVVDAQSDDGTLEEVQRVRKRMGPLRTDWHIIEQTLEPGKAGIPAAWNLALDHVDQEVVFILNADDWYEPAAAATVLDAFAADRHLDMVISPIQYRPHPDAPVQRVQQPRSLDLLPVLMPIPHPGCFVRRSLYGRIGRFDETYAVSADYDFIYRAHNAGSTLRVLDQPLVNMQPGGFARQRLSLARRETRNIACRHGKGRALPWLAFIVRTILNR